MNWCTIQTLAGAALASLFLLPAETAQADHRVPLRRSEYDRWEQYFPDYRPGSPIDSRPPDVELDSEPPDLELDVEPGGVKIDADSPVPDLDVERPGLEIENEGEIRRRYYDARIRPYYDIGVGDYEWQMPSYLKRYHRFRRGYSDIFLNDYLVEPPAYVYPDTGGGPPGFGTGDWR